MKKTKIKILKSGYYIKPDGQNILYSKNQEQKSYAGFALIQHPELGYILFDTGFSRYFEDATKDFPYHLCSKYINVSLESESNTLVQLSMLGINPDEISYVIISHFHPEHIAGLRHFENAKFICSSRAYQNIRNKKGLKAVLKGFLPDLLPLDFEERVIFADDYSKQVELGCLGVCYDIFSDKSIFIVPLNGHVKGHIGIITDTDDGKKFLVGDACPNSDVYKQKSFPISEILLTVEKKKSYIDSLNRIRNYYKENPDVEIIPAHCPIYWKDKT